MYRGETSHPVFVALKGRWNATTFPWSRLTALIRAFEQDQTVTRYADFDEVLAIA